VVVFLQVAHSDAVLPARQGGSSTLMVKTSLTASSVDFTGAFALNTALLDLGCRKERELAKQQLRSVRLRLCAGRKFGNLIDCD
jgi:hypothetical protein